MDSKSIGLCPQGLESPRCRCVSSGVSTHATNMHCNGGPQTFLNVPAWRNASSCVPFESDMHCLAAKHLRECGHVGFSRTSLVHVSAWLRERMLGACKSIVVPRRGPRNAAQIWRMAWLVLLKQYRLRAQWVHSSVVRAADCRSAGPWLKSGCALEECLA